VIRVWLHEGVDADPGWNAWGLGWLGFATWAPTRGEVLEQIPAKLAEHLAWLDSHGLSSSRPGPEIAVQEEVRGNEVLFGPDRLPATVEEIDRTVRLLDCSRRDLLATVGPLADRILDWDPPYRRFARWADWRTIRAILAHLANSETHYYLRHVGYLGPHAPARPEDDWRVFLGRSRGEALAFLDVLKAAPDRARVKESASEHWSVRKALRRMVRHERMHCKSIRRIVRAYQHR
jgi:hypothetical protein